MLVHRKAVRALLLTPDHEILLIRIRPPDGAECFWIAPGGGLEEGETAEEGLRRELHEELGLRDFVPGRSYGGAITRSTGLRAGFRSARIIAWFTSRASSR